MVGEVPGAGDPDADRWRGGNYTGMAYTARHSGRRIREPFESLGYAPESLYFTNAVQQRRQLQITHSSGQKATPTAAETSYSTVKRT